jgi:17beta-estradiol 17-dehydrogenase / very-long-chain 3-oxoacyl-CoA reductase
MVFGCLCECLSVQNLFKVIFFYFIVKLILFVYKNFFRKRLNFKERYGSSSWALVTGATDGFGRAYVEQLAKEGFNIILVSRSAEKLTKVANEIKSSYMVEVQTIPFDFSKLVTVEEYRKAFGNLQATLDISILVNNVGVSIGGFFNNLSIEEIKNCIDINVIPQTLITKILEEKMSKRKYRSAIINLSSFASTFPMAGVAMYCATKSYNDFLSRALSAEYEGNNIDVLDVKPLYAETNLTQLKAQKFVITATQSVEGALNDLGYERETYGHIKHKIQAYFITSFIAIPGVFGLMRMIRKRTKTKVL